MKSLLKTLFFFLLLTQISFGQLERQDELIDKRKRLDYLFKPTVTDSTQLDSIINSRMALYHIPGLSALITTKENGIIWKRNYGYANILQNLPVEDTTLFYLASISKTIVATAIMQLWEADSFDLDDPVNEYLDNFQVINPHRLNDTITIRMLMTHTSTIRDYWPVIHSLDCCGDSPISLDSFLINYLTPGGSYYNPNNNFYNTDPGTQWQYSNVAVCILALLVENFSGLPFDQYCKTYIFDKLEMSKTSWRFSEIDSSEVATPYLWVSGGQYSPYCHQGHPFYPAGNLRSNKLELEQFLSAYMNWGRYKGNIILDSSTVALILQDHLGFPIPGYGDYQGLIWYQSGELNGRFPWGHQGSWWGSKTGMFFKQEEDWGIICLMNSEVSNSGLIYLLNLLCDYAQDITDVEEISNIISDFYLEQNYPNPFNPNTTISWQSPFGSHQTIKVFDVLGNEIATLVDEYKPAGSYEVEFDASRLASGIYFYKLQAGDYTAVKKMILIK